MPDYVTQEQHREFTTGLDARFDEIKAENKRQNERIKKTEEWQEQFSEMQATLKTQGQALTELTDKVNTLVEKPAKRWDYILNNCLVAILSAVIGYLVGFVFA